MSLVFLVGCRFDLPEIGVDGVDAPGGEGNPNCMLWTTRGGHVSDLCTMPPGPSWRVDTLGATYNTDDGSYTGGTAPTSFLIDQMGPLKLRVVSVADFSVAPGASLRVIGLHPLLVLSWSTITVAGTLDVSSQRIFSVSPGAGANRSGCTAAGNGQGGSNSGGGGGGGLSQGGRNGGTGDQAGTPNQGGMFVGSIARPERVVLGGCRGGNGGNGPSAGIGGSSGGAIQLTAKTSITIESTGRIHAGGQGGGGGMGNGGGGGGGSGGFIGLDAPMVTTEVGSILAANGGGGAAGCQTGDGDEGQDGQLTFMVAAGGVGANCGNGASGGAGGFRGTSPTTGASSNFSGGGGGGGAGYVLIWAPESGFVLLPGAILSPLQVHVEDVETR